MMAKHKMKLPHKIEKHHMGKETTAPKVGHTKKATHLRGGLKQTEGYVPPASLPTPSRAGGKKVMKAREKRLEKMAM
jgi:hypothetical protein